MTHVTRVVAAVEGMDAKIVAALHDVVEKSDWTLEDLTREGFAPAVLAGVDAMTKRPGEDFAAHVERAAADPLARRVKRADLEDNLRAWRLARPSSERNARLERYGRALAWLDAQEESP